MKLGQLTLATVTKAALATLAFATLVGCNNKNPEYTGRPDIAAAAPEKPAPETFEKRFEFSTAEQTATQDKFDKNTVSVLFAVKGEDGVSINNIKERDLQVTENGISVSPFKLTADEQRSSHIVDIVFVVDTTKSMIPFIASATRRIQDFVVSTRKRGYHTRMCFSTFGDTVGKKCDHFYDNNPDDASTESQVRELLSDLGSVKALPKNDDPANTDIPENPMRALIEATKAPWAADSQRFVILVTDAGFLSAPDNLGAMYKAGKLPAEAMPPTMAETDKVIRDAQIRVFAVTPRLPGYTGQFQGEDGIVEATQGKHFLFSNVLRNPNSLNAILEKIIEDVNTTYKIEYVVDDTQGLNPTLKVEDRHVVVTPKIGAASVSSVLSSMPTGRAQYKQTWKLSEQDIQTDSVQVYVDGKKLEAGDFTVNKSEVTLKAVPKAGASLRFVFFYQNIGSNLRVEQIAVSGNGDPRDIKVFLNGKEARSADYTIERDLQGNAIVHLIEASVLASNDPYDIRKGHGVDVKVITNYRP